jgi:hypothetical protein
MVPNHVVLGGGTQGHGWEVHQEDWHHCKGQFGVFYGFALLVGDGAASSFIVCPLPQANPPK